MCLVLGLMGLLLASYGGLCGILTGLTKSTDHPSFAWAAVGELHQTTIVQKPYDVLFIPIVVI